jgi:hypothetical protein
MNIGLPLALVGLAISFTYIAVLHYENKGHNKTGNPDPVRARDYEVWTDKDGDKGNLGAYG